MQPESRLCTKCAVEKPLSEFSKAPRGKYGRKASCKECDASRHAKLTEGRERKKPGKPKGQPKDPASPKTCRACGVTKTHADFSLSRQATETQNAVYRSECKECSSVRARQWFADNSDRANDNRRRWNLQKTYGLSVTQYNALMRKQGGVCAVCGKSELSEHGRTGKQFRLAVDHCHRTGAIRGLLCQKCNRAIGLLDDSPALMRKAISYLLRAQKELAGEETPGM